LASRITASRSIVRRLEARVDSGEARPTELRQLEQQRGALELAVATKREASKAELAIWREVWRLPQAAEWERAGCVREVALYARWTALAEAGDLKAAGEARMLSDRLGLNPAALVRLRWQIGDPASVVALPHVRGSSSRKRYAGLRVGEDTRPGPMSLEERWGMILGAQGLEVPVSSDAGAAVAYEDGA
jgi:hypothetical protein